MRNDLLSLKLTHEPPHRVLRGNPLKEDINVALSYLLNFGLPKFRNIDNAKRWLAAEVAKDPAKWQPVADHFNRLLQVVRKPVVVAMKPKRTRQPKRTEHTPDTAA